MPKILTNSELRKTLHDEENSTRFAYTIMSKSKCRKENRNRRKAEHEDLLTSENDVASLAAIRCCWTTKLRCYNQGDSRPKKQTSDVTSQVLNIRRQKNDKSQEYHTDLETQAQERYQHRKQSREEQRVKSVEHLKTMDSIWGRPGAGAPLRREHMDFAKKQKLGIAPADSSFTYRDA
ncbi:hypothetical protein OS493_016264 [Desmophyllum pertusum]|uniref:Uncharacterized protein n=1 Tax=Desmophyllum pertusum TaxID=174260 RepID=A0A9X0A1X1_9CNID|nr:hypothetical protein OS493_016264 [Desmophyllum pertusum]